MLKKKNLLRNFLKRQEYISFRSSNKIIYVGKAKNLKKGSVLFQRKTSGKTLRLVNKINDVNYILVQNELDALLLENNLIKKYQPKYNVLMKEDDVLPLDKNN